MSAVYEHVSLVLLRSFNLPWFTAETEQRRNDHDWILFINLNLHVQQQSRAKQTGQNQRADQLLLTDSNNEANSASVCHPVFFLWALSSSKINRSLILVTCLPPTLFLLPHIALSWISLLTLPWSLFLLFLFDHGGGLSMSSRKWAADHHESGETSSAWLLKNTACLLFSTYRVLVFQNNTQQNTALFCTGDLCPQFNPFAHS